MLLLVGVNYCLLLFLWNFGSVAADADNAVYNDTIFKNRLYSEQDGYYWQSPYEPISGYNMTLDKYIWKNVAKWEDKVAIESSVTGTKYTYWELRQHCLAVATRLRNVYGFVEEDVLGIVMSSTIEFSIAMLGAIEAGLVVTALTPTGTVDEIMHLIAISRPKVFVTESEFVEKLRTAVHEAGLHDPLIFVTGESDMLPDGLLEFNQLMQINEEFIPLDLNIDPDNTCLIPYSSGTSGLPKGVMLSHINLVANSEILNAKLPYERTTAPTTKDNQDVLPIGLPLSHLYGAENVLISKFALGCKVIIIPDYTSDTFFNVLLNNDQITLYIVPMIMEFLAKSDNVTAEHLKGVKNIISAAGPVGKSEAEIIAQKAPHVHIFQEYGMTETAPMTMLGQIGSTNYASIGWPAPSTLAKVVKVDGDSFKGIGINETGELLVKNVCIMKGYLGNKKATDETILSDGWMRTGDLVRYDYNGDFYIADRIKELIKVVDEQVPPAELEDCLRQHPKILNAGVVGVPDEVYSQVPRVFVVRKKGCDLTSDEVRQYMASKLSDNKQPRGGVYFIDEIPTSPRGKLLRRVLSSMDVTSLKNQ